MFLKTVDLTKIYKNDKIKNVVLKDINLEIKKGQIVVILGPSGSGKSTLLNMLSSLDKKSKGYIFYDGKIISNLDFLKTRFRKNKVGFVFQDCYLLKHLTVLENIILAKRLSKNSFSCDEVIEMVNLKDKLNLYPHQLSGGERSRVSIARAIIKNPEILFCDEPTGALDEENGKKVLASLVNINKMKKTTIIIVTHNQGIALIGDRIISMQDGQIISNRKNKRKNPLEINWG